MNQYLLLLHENPADFAQVSPAQMKEIAQQYKRWAGGLAERGLLAGGEKLTDDGGRVLRLKNGAPLATDGPYAEAHDVIGGYFVVNAESDAMAEELAQGCPHLRGTRWGRLRRHRLAGHRALVRAARASAGGAGGAGGLARAARGGRRSPLCAARSRCAGRRPRRSRAPCA